MARWVSLLSTIGVACTALYLLALGGAALVRPALARTFLGGFVSSATTHFVEVALRILSGLALVAAAPRMIGEPVVAAFGWILVGTSVVLAVVPWRLHQRFAAWVVPRATEHLPLIGVASIAAGCALGTALWLPRAAAPAFDLEATRATIAQLNKQFTDAHVAGDVDAIDAMFLPDARSYPPDAPAAIGLAAIHALTVDFLKAGVTAFREETTAFYGGTDLVVDEGTYVLTYGAGVTERGKYINIWNLVNGSWRIQANIWNADPPPATPK